MRQKASGRGGTRPESLSTQEDYLNQTIRLYNVLFRTLSALFEELYEGASPR